MPPSRCSTISTPGRWRTTRRDFAQDDLDEARVLVDLRREVFGPCRGLNLREVDVASFRLGDDFLRHHHDVAVRRCEPAAFAAGDDERGQVVARTHQGNIGNRHQRDGHGSRALIRNPDGA